MLALIQFNLPTFTVALVIGIVTGRWIFADRRRRPAPPEDPPQP